MGFTSPKIFTLDFLQEVLISAAPLAYPVGGFLAIFAYFSIAFHGLYLVKNFLFFGTDIFSRNFALRNLRYAQMVRGFFLFPQAGVFSRVFGILQHIQTAQGVFLPPKPVLYWTFWSLRVEIWSSQ